MAHLPRAFTFAALVTLVTLVNSGTAHAAKPPPETSAQKQERNKELQAELKNFTDACITAFQKSQGDAVTETARELCQCTADEAGEEKIKLESLRTETARITQDPKYQIQDKLLLQSFHVCTADAMIDADHRSRQKAAQ